MYSIFTWPFRPFGFVNFPKKEFSGHQSSMISKLTRLNRSASPSSDNTLFAETELSTVRIAFAILPPFPITDPKSFSLTLNSITNDESPNRNDLYIIRVSYKIRRKKFN
eukprot:UN00790